jgi:ABC-type multidrug transport system permease subunit
MTGTVRKWCSVGAAALLGVAVVGIITNWHLVASNFIPRAQQDLPWDIGIVYLPFWASASLMLGLLLLVGLFVTRSAQRRFAWLFLLLLLAYTLQITTGSGFFVLPLTPSQESAGAVSIFTRLTSVTAEWWTFAIMIGAVLGVGVADRLLERRGTPTRPSKNPPES